MVGWSKETHGEQHTMIIELIEITCQSLSTPFDHVIFGDCFHFIAIVECQQQIGIFLVFAYECVDGDQQIVRMFVSGFRQAILVVGALCVWQRNLWKFRIKS